MNDRFGRAESFAAGRADDLLRWVIGTDRPEADSGNVEAPTGWFALVDIDRATVAEYASEQGDPWITERRNFAPGTYLVMINELGSIMGYYYTDKADAERDYADLDAEYGKWDQPAPARTTQHAITTEPMFVRINIAIPTDKAGRELVIAEVNKQIPAEFRQTYADFIDPDLAAETDDPDEDGFDQSDLGFWLLRWQWTSAMAEDLVVDIDYDFM